MKKLFLSLASLALMAGAFAKSDVTTTYLTNADLKSLEGWTIGTEFGGNGYTDWQTNGDVPVIEFYHTWNSNAGGEIGSTKTFNFSQTVELPKGYYRLAVNAFYREGNGNGTNTKAYIYAGEEYKQYVIGLTSAGVGSYTGSNDLYKAANAFSKGDFSNEFDFELVDDGEIEIGFHGYIDTYCSWCILGPVTLWKYEAADFLTDYEEKYATAQGLLASPMGAQERADLQAAMVDKSTLETIEAIQAASRTLNSAIVSAQASIAVFATVEAKLAAMKELVDATNVYTAAAYEAYYAQPAAKFQNGTMTTEEASALQYPNTITGWHAAVTVDNFLLSAWDTNPDFPDGVAYYINTWSNEGENDGSEFKVPFFEYWIGDAESLGEKTLTATMTGLTAYNNYQAEVIVRVRQKNNAEGAPAGITFQVGEGEAVSATAGAQVGTSQFYLDTIAAVGAADAEGKLTIKFNVAADNNISWLSFKNVTYTAIPTVLPVNSVANAIACYEAGVLKANDSVAVQGIITKMELKPTNFKKYGSVNIWVVDNQGDEQNFEFYNCYSLDGDTLAYFGPNFNLTGTDFVEVDTVVDRSGRMIVKGDKITAIGKYTYYAKGSQHELNTGCYVIDGVRFPPVDVEISPESGDIAAALAEASTPNVANITINLKAGATYTLSSPIVVPNNLTISGDAANPAIIVIDEENTGDFVKLNGTTELAVKKDGTDSDHKLISSVYLYGIKIQGLKGAFITDAQKTLVENLTVTDVVVEIPGGNKNVFNFNGKGYIGALYVKNSTIYATENNTGFFAQYGSRPKNVNEDWTQLFSVENSTIVNIAYGKNMCDLKQNGTAQNLYVLSGNLFVNCGKKGQVIVGFNKGQSSATPGWSVSGNAFNFDGEDVGQAEVDKAANDIAQNTVFGVMTFAGADNFGGKFALAEGAVAPMALGDPRWTIKFAPFGLREWDFTKGADYAGAISSDIWTDPSSSKGRGSYIPVLENGELMASEGVKLELTEGLFFTAATKQILVGFTGNYFLQFTGGSVTMTVPECAAGDTIIAGYCTSGKNKEATIVSESIEENVSTTVSSKDEYRMVVKTAGDVALTCNANSRFYTLTVKAYNKANGEYVGPEPTAISELAAPAENNAAVYDLQGRRANGKGLLIRNGKVVLVK
jgi:hypothetical protein